MCSCQGNVHIQEMHKDFLFFLLVQRKDKNDVQKDLEKVKKDKQIVQQGISILKLQLFWQRFTTFL